MPCFPSVLKQGVQLLSNFLKVWRGSYGRGLYHQTKCLQLANILRACDQNASKPEQGCSAVLAAPWLRTAFSDKAIPTVVLGAKEYKQD